MVDADAIDSVRVLVGAVAAVAQLVSESAVYLVGAESGSDLGLNAGNAGFQGGQGRPVASVQGQLAHGRRVDRCAYRGGSRLNIRQSAGHLDQLLDLARLQADVQR